MCLSLLQCMCSLACALTAHSSPHQVGCRNGLTRNPLRKATAYMHLKCSSCGKLSRSKNGCMSRSKHACQSRGNLCFAISIHAVNFQDQSMHVSQEATTRLGPPSQIWATSTAQLPDGQAMKSNARQVKLALRCLPACYQEAALRSMLQPRRGPPLDTEKYPSLRQPNGTSKHSAKARAAPAAHRHGRST